MDIHGFNQRALDFEKLARPSYGVALEVIFYLVFLLASWHPMPHNLASQVGPLHSRLNPVHSTVSLLARFSCSLPLKGSINIYPSLVVYTFLSNNIESEFSMEDQLKSEQNNKDPEDSKSPKPQGLSHTIIPHILNLYGSRATAKDFEIYDPNATFEDPLMCAHGVKQIKSAFYSVAKIFSESKIVEYSVQENATAPGKAEILIDSKQHYKIFGKDVDITSLIKLNIQEGKIIRHEDWWDGNPLKNRETVKPAFVGRLAEKTRRGSMIITHAMMRFGKDPRP